MDKDLEILLEQLELDAAGDAQTMEWVSKAYAGYPVNVDDIIKDIENRYDYSSDRGEAPFQGAASWLHDARCYKLQQRIFGKGSV